MESVEENQTNANSDEPNLYGLQEIEQDFHDGWYWAYLPNEEDTGPEYGPFLGKQQLLCDPCINEPEYFFNEMFSPAMFETIVESTNRYATHKVQLRGRFFLFILS